MNISLVLRVALVVLAVAPLTTEVRSQEVGIGQACIKYYKCIPLDLFKCESITRSTFIRRVCYMEAKRYMIIQLNDTYYHYCNIGSETVTSLLSAPSMGQYYNLQ